MMSAVHRIYRSNAQWLGHAGRIFFSWAIFNPNGPTIYSVGATDCGDPNTKAVFYRWVNPFKQGSYGLGRMDVASGNWPKQLDVILSRAVNSDARDVDSDFPFYTCIPSMMTFTGEEAIDAVCREMLRAGLSKLTFDWGRELALRKRYGTDLFGRAAAEIAEAVEQLEHGESWDDSGAKEYAAMLRMRYAAVPEFRNWTPTSFESAPYDDRRFDEWLGLTTDQPYLVPALGSLANAWVGALHTATKLPISIDFDELNRFFWHYDMPLWPNEFTAVRLAQQMGLGNPNAK